MKKIRRNQFISFLGNFNSLKYVYIKKFSFYHYFLKFFKNELKL